MSETQKKVGIGSLIAIMSIFFFAPDVFIIAPILARIAQSYPTVSMPTITFLLTGTSAAGLVGSLITGVVLGRRISYKALTLLTFVVYIIFGGMPFFFEMSFGFMLFARLIFGVACGCLLPIAQTYIARAYEDETKRASVIGYGMALFNIGIIVGIMAGGILGSVNWHYTFGFYLLGVIPLILMALFFKEPEKEAGEEMEKGFKVPKEIFTSMVFTILIVFLLAQVGATVYSTYISFVVEELGGTPVLTSTISIVNTVALLLVAVAFGQLYRLFKQYVLPISLALFVVANVALYFGGSLALIPVLFVGAAFTGFAVSMISSAVPMLLSIRVPKSAFAPAMSAAFIFQNLGVFLGTPFLMIIGVAFGAGSAAYLSYIPALVLFLILFIISVPFGVALRKAAIAKGKDEEGPPPQKTPPYHLDKND